MRSGILTILAVELKGLDFDPNPDIFRGQS